MKIDTCGIGDAEGYRFHETVPDSFVTRTCKVRKPCLLTAVSDKLITVQISVDLLIDAAENRRSMFIHFIATQVTKQEFDEFIAKRMRDELRDPKEISKSANQESRWIFGEKRCGRGSGWWKSL